MLAPPRLRMPRMSRAGPTPDGRGDVDVGGGCGLGACPGSMVSSGSTLGRDFAMAVRPSRSSTNSELGTLFANPLAMRASVVADLSPVCHRL